MNKFPSFFTFKFLKTFDCHARCKCYNSTVRPILITNINSTTNSQCSQYHISESVSLEFPPKCRLSCLSNSCKWPTWRTIIFSICALQFSACFQQPRAHHQQNQLYQYNIWYVSFCVGDRLVCRSGSVSSNLVLIIRRINCINTISSMCHSV
jgi:hypothetical protein